MNSPLALVSHVSLVSELLAGLVGAVAMSKGGWALAMAVSIYAGRTEPRRVDLPYPWLALALGWATCAAGVLLQRRAGMRVAGTVVAHVAAISTALLPFWYLYRLLGRI